MLWKHTRVVMDIMVITDLIMDIPGMDIIGVVMVIGMVEVIIMDLVIMADIAEAEAMVSTEDKFQSGLI